MMAVCFAKEIKNIPEKNISGKKNVVASTSWTAAFADLAGVDVSCVIAPSNLRHPPEYEITVSDIKKISDCDFFIYAGFERMMKILGEAVGNSTMIKISCVNSIEAVKENVAIISNMIGTQKQSEKNVAEYIKTIEEGRALVEKNGLKNAKVLCNKNQIYLAEDLGLNVIETFGPGPIASKQILNAKESRYDLIIDNVHNPVGVPLLEVSENSKYVVWRNFPEKIEKNALVNVIKNNIDMLEN